MKLKAFNKYIAIPLKDIAISRAILNLEVFLSRSITLLVVLGGGEHIVTETVDFLVENHPTMYNAIFARVNLTSKTILDLQGLEVRLKANLLKAEAVKVMGSLSLSIEDPKRVTKMIAIVLPTKKSCSLLIEFIVLVLYNPMNPCRAMSMQTNTSRTSSLIADDEELEFLMDSHSGRILAGHGGHVTDNTGNRDRPAADCGRARIQTAKGQKILGFITVGRAPWDRQPWMLKRMKYRVKVRMVNLKGKKRYMGKKIERM
ncbi:hypothetical protein J1N35_000754 [Gossypium stocksii]|uniref:Uncharacterized protein n=1 Tax=Gossypium stocksii TaxID=47602 RepID=A0A9D4AKT0_9ROSI|nr:hypothetical protein J1N35_000754 [Gossypium stocksii]